MIKTLRNCWLSVKTVNKELRFPPFEDFCRNFGSKASFKFIEDLYNLEVDKCAKLGFRLNANAIFPSNIQRQKVNLALRIFDESTTSALARVYPTESQSTCNFSKVILKFWKIFNVNNFTKGQNKNDPD